MKNDFKFLQGTTQTLSCCFCNVEITDGGNDPQPITVDNPTDRCCDACNWERVIPGRVFLQQRGLTRPFVNRIEQFKQAHPSSFPNESREVGLL